MLDDRMSCLLKKRLKEDLHQRKRSRQAIRISVEINSLMQSRAQKRRPRTLDTRLFHIILASLDPDPLCSIKRILSDRPGLLISIPRAFLVAFFPGSRRRGPGSCDVRRPSTRSARTWLRKPNNGRRKNPGIIRPIKAILAPEVVFGRVGEGDAEFQCLDFLTSKLFGG